MGEASGVDTASVVDSELKWKNGSSRVKSTLLPHHHDKWHTINDIV